MEVPPWEPVRNDSLPPTLSPAVPPYVKLGLTAVYTAFYALLFVFIYAQLWLVLRYRHKRLSYQSVFLFLCLFWASLRTVLFSFYFRDFVAANSFSPFVFWLLYCFPVCLQFFTLTLMNLYFTQVRDAHLPGSPTILREGAGLLGRRWRGSGRGAGSKVLRPSIPSAGPIRRRLPAVPKCREDPPGAGSLLRTSHSVLMQGVSEFYFPPSPLLISRHLLLILEGHLCVGSTLGPGTACWK